MSSEESIVKDQITSIKNAIMVKDLERAYREVINLRDLNIVPVYIFNEIFSGVLRRLEEEELERKRDDQVRLAEVQTQNFAKEKEKEEELQKEHEKELIENNGNLNNEFIDFEGLSKDLKEIVKELDEVENEFIDAINKTGENLVSSISKFTEKTLANLDGQKESLAESMNQIRKVEKDLEKFEQSGEVSGVNASAIEGAKKAIAQKKEETQILQTATRKVSLMEELRNRSQKLEREEANANFLGSSSDKGAMTPESSKAGSQVSPQSRSSVVKGLKEKLSESSKGDEEKVTIDSPAPVHSLNRDGRSNGRSI